MLSTRFAPSGIRPGQYWGDAPGTSFAGIHQKHPCTIITLQGAKHCQQHLLLCKESFIAKDVLFSFEAAPRRSMLREEILAPLYITKKTYVLRDGCESLASRVMTRDHFPPKKWIPHLLHPCIPQGDPFITCVPQGRSVLLTALLVLPSPLRF